MEVALVMIAAIGYLGFREWLRHQRRALIHRERLAALEKGVALPPLEQEGRRREWNVQRILLLAGLIWISLGIALGVTLNAVINNSSPVRPEVPAGFQWIGLAPVAIGVSHLIVYWVGKKRENTAERG